MFRNNLGQYTFIQTGYFSLLFPYLQDNPPASQVNIITLVLNNRSSVTNRIICHSRAAFRL